MSQAAVWRRHGGDVPPPRPPSPSPTSLLELCRAGRNLDAIAKLYSPSVVSIESIGSDTMPAKMSGIDAIRQKNEWWYETSEVNSVCVEGPFVRDDQFAVRYDLETPAKAKG